MSHVYFAPVFGLMPVQCLTYFDGSLSCLLNSWNSNNKVDYDNSTFGSFLLPKTPWLEAGRSETSYLKENIHQWKNMKQKTDGVIWQKSCFYRKVFYIVRSQSVQYRCTFQWFNKVAATQYFKQNVLPWRGKENLHPHSSGFLFLKNYFESQYICYLGNITRQLM